MSWRIRATKSFWATIKPFRLKYPEREYHAIIKTIREAIAELERQGYISETGWDEHRLTKPPLADGCHFELHIHDDDVLVVYFKRERNRVIRMVGVYDHLSIPTA